MESYKLYSNFEKLEKHKITAEISADSLTHNYKLLCSRTPNCEHICVVKADAYGHVADICVRELLNSGCTFFAVSCIEEAIDVRKICLDEQKEARVLILGYTDPELASVLHKYDIIQTVLSLENASRLASESKAQGCQIRVHVAVDTGMNRIGVSACSDAECTKAVEEIEKILKFDSLKTEGMFTHFARSDEELSVTVTPYSHTAIQGKRFLRVRELLLQKGIKLFAHACNSAAAVRFPEFKLDAVRLGIMLYGIYPSRYVERIGLKPVMKLKTVVAHVHTVPIGETVSYGGTYKAQTETSIATLPIGYADGFIRAYTSAAVTVYTNDGAKRANVVGRVCMDQCMIDVTGLDVRAGDEVVIFGEDENDLSRLASLSQTIEYECLCLISARVPRCKI